MNYHQLGTALHKEYEAKYSVPNSIGDAAQDSINLPSKMMGAAATIITAVFVSLVSIFI